MIRIIGGALLVGSALLAGSSSLRLSAQPAVVTSAPICSNFDIRASTANRPGIAPLQWRTDFPDDAPARTHAWDGLNFRTEWKTYIGAVLSEVQASGLTIDQNRIILPPNAEWWITPWMDYGPNGREAMLGLTKERGPDDGDLSPTSRRGAQVWAIGFYNREGASALHDVFADPCNPAIPAAGWTFPNGTMSFKLLFTDASITEVPYLTNAPTVEALIDPPGSSSGPRPVPQRTKTTLRLIQMDIAVRDSRAPMGWIFGTFVWQNNQSGLYGDLTPVGLMWGNDPNADADPVSSHANLTSTRINDELAEILWHGGQTSWPERPWPGFQGRLNGPADNLKSSCMSCHALAQWPRSQRLGILPRPSSRFTLPALADPARRLELRTNWMKDVRGGDLTDPAEATPAAGWGGARSLDYSLQLEASFSRLCEACGAGVLQGPTPAVCKVPGGRVVVTTARCKPAGARLNTFAAPPSVEQEPPRQ